MKPLSTGSEMKPARKPRRRQPGDERDDPGRRAPAPTVSATNVGRRAGVAKSATAAADSAAVADIGPTTRWRELPNSA